MTLPNGGMKPIICIFHGLSHDAFRRFIAQKQAVMIRWQYARTDPPNPPNTTGERPKPRPTPQPAETEAAYMTIETGHESSDISEAELAAQLTAQATQEANEDLFAFMEQWTHDYRESKPRRQRLISSRTGLQGIHGEIWQSACLES